MTDVKLLLETRLQDWLTTEAANLQTDEARQLLRSIETVIARAGKRARPRLLFATYKAYGGENMELLLDVGLALELHHQFLLVHDDVMDDDITRNGRPNIAGLYLKSGSSKLVATAMAILAGDLLASYADRVILEHFGLKDAQKVVLLQLLHQTNSAVLQGQQLDVLDVTAQAADVSEERLLTVSTLKTATYTVQLPMQMAAELCGLSKSERQAIDRFATAFGILYQLVDDYSDYFPNASSMDKESKLRDFQQAKITYPLRHTLLAASPEDTAQIQEWIGTKRLTESQQKHVISLLRKYQADTALAEVINAYQLQATKALKQLALTESRRAEIAMILKQYQI